MQSQFPSAIKSHCAMLSLRPPSAAQNANKNCCSAYWGHQHTCMLKCNQNKKRLCNCAFFYDNAEKIKGIVFCGKFEVFTTRNSCNVLMTFSHHRCQSIAGTPSTMKDYFHLPWSNFFFLFQPQPDTKLFLARRTSFMTFPVPLIDTPHRELIKILLKILVLNVLMLITAVGYIQS